MVAEVTKVKTVHIGLGFFFVLNFCVGTGFLGIPYAFFYSGYLAAIPTLLLVAFISWTNANYVLEVMARAQALEYFKMSQKRAIVDNSSDDFSVERKHPSFEITVWRKFEVVELCEIFFNKWVKYIYLIILNVYCFLALWSFSTVAGSAWAINIPYNFSGVVKCDSNPDPFQHTVLPMEASCRNAYYFSLFLFAVIVVTLSLLDLKEQAIFQLILGLLRFFTVGCVVVYALVKLTQGRDVCGIYDSPPSNSSSLRFDPWDLYEFNYTSVEDIVVKFDPKGWVTAIPVMTYAFILHQGLASLTHPIKQKMYMWYLTLAMFSISCFCYMILGVVGPLWFKQSIQETITLNFSGLTSSEHSIALRLLAYYVIIFPSVDVASAYPLMVHTIVNNIFIIIAGHDTSEKATHEHKYRDLLIKVILRLLAAILPILAAFGAANLIFVLTYAGLIGFNICFFFPTLLQLRSIYVCTKRFTPNVISISGSQDDDKLEERQSLLKVQSGRMMFTKDREGLRSKYMTPYSSYVLSHPVAVVIIGILGVCLFLLTVASLGVKPHKVTC